MRQKSTCTFYHGRAQTVYSTVISDTGVISRMLFMRMLLVSKIRNISAVPREKPTLWTLRNVSTQISPRIPRRVIKYRVIIPETVNPQEAKSV